MKANRLVWFLILLFVNTVFQLPAEQSEADRRLLTELRVEAEKGDAQCQALLGDVFHFGLLTARTDYGEAAKWVQRAAMQNHSLAQYNLARKFHRRP